MAATTGGSTAGGSSTTTSDSLVSRILQEVLVASEHLSTRLEEGVTALMTGELPKLAATTTKARAINPMTMDFDALNDDEVRQLVQQQGEHMMDHSPLEGIAESVLGDIFQGSVRSSTTGKRTWSKRANQGIEAERTCCV